MAGKLALITGVSRREGLGFAVARALTASGFEVVLTARDVAAAQRLAEEIGEQAAAVPLDVTRDTSVQACVAELARRNAPLGALINNAAGGFDLHQSVLDADLDFVRVALEVNVLGHGEPAKPCCRCSTARPPPGSSTCPPRPAP